MFESHLCRDSWFLCFPPSMVGHRYINMGAKCQWRWPWLPRCQCGADRSSTVGLEVCVFLEWHLETRWGTLTHLNALWYGHFNCSTLQNKEIKDPLKNHISLGIWPLKIYCSSVERFFSHLPWWR